MSEFHRVAATSDIPANTMRAFVVEGRRILVIHHASGFSAGDNSCPHRGGPLCEGDLLRNEVVCPWHLWGFDVVTGKNDRFPEVAMVMHEVKIENDSVLVRLNSPKEQG